jgi:hypothetical protein
VRVITSNKKLLEHSSCRSMACMLNASGAKPCNLANAISGATMAGRFLDALLKDFESIGPGNTICHAFPRGDEYPNRRYHPKIFDYPLSRSSCPRETQLVVKLLDGLLSQIATNMTLPLIDFDLDIGDSILDWGSKVASRCDLFTPWMERSLASIAAERTFHVHQDSFFWVSADRLYNTIDLWVMGTIKYIINGRMVVSG